MPDPRIGLANFILSKWHTIYKMASCPAKNRELQHRHRIIFPLLQSFNLRLSPADQNPHQHANSMALSIEAIIAIIGIVITLPPTVIIAWTIIRRKKGATSRLQGVEASICLHL